MSDAPLTEEAIRILTAMELAGTAGTGAEPLAARTGLDKAVVLEHLVDFWDRGLVEQMAGVRGLYRITDAGRAQLA